MAPWATLVQIKPPLGTIIQFATDTYAPYLRGYHSTIIGFDPQDGAMPYLVGWKEGEKMPDTGVSRIRVPWGSFLPDLGSYIRSVWISGRNTARVMQLGSGVGGTGMACVARYCNAFNPYGQPNMPDGSYICYTCRQRPACMR
jgi:hypothetical protein